MNSELLKALIAATERVYGAPVGPGMIENSAAEILARVPELALEWGRILTEHTAPEIESSRHVCMAMPGDICDCKVQ